MLNKQQVLVSSIFVREKHQQNTLWFGGRQQGGAGVVCMAESDGRGNYSSSEDDVVGFGRPIRDPRKTKTEIMRDSLKGKDGGVFF